MIFSMPLFRDLENRIAWLEIKKSSSPYENLDDYKNYILICCWLKSTAGLSEKCFAKQSGKLIPTNLPL